MNAYFKGNPIFGPRGPAGPDGNPIGTIISFMGYTAPTDYLICDGSVCNISDYPDLANFFKEQFGDEYYFGGSDGQFAVPDMRNLFLRGYRGEANEQLSGEIGEKQEATVSPYVEGGPKWFGGSVNSIVRNTDSQGNQSEGVAYAEIVDKSWKSAAWYSSRPVNMAVLYCIKAISTEPILDEYDTEVDGCQWHVRKWSDGYCEMVGSRRFTNLPIINKVGEIYNSFGTESDNDYSLPVKLVKRYDEILSVDSEDIDKSVFIGYAGYDNVLERTKRFYLFRPAPTTMTLTVFFHVTGRWK